MLLTIVLLVAAKAQVNTPKNPNIFLIVFEMARSFESLAFLSTKMKKNSQLIILIAYWKINGVD
jgi:hypothetical protein